MKNVLAAATVVLLLAGSGAVYAQHRGGMHHDMRANPEDRAAFADARIAAVKAGLKLTPDQEKLWPPLETAVRDFAKMRIDRANARMESRKDGNDNTNDNPVQRLQRHADVMAATAAGLKRIADAADPLYKTLDDGQKRRLLVLTRGAGRLAGERWLERSERGGRHGMGRDMDRGRNRDGDSDRDSSGNGESGSGRL